MNAIIGNNLKILRKANRFSQEQVSSFLKIERSTYSNYESGDREAPLDILERASDLFGCELHLLFENDNAIVENMLTCAFRIDNLSDSDMKSVASFKNIVKNYLKLNELIAR
jgi:transcriptional regulator with XRE-family HTH domain